MNRPIRFAKNERTAAWRVAIRMAILVGFAGSHQPNLKHGRL